MLGKDVSLSGSKDLLKDVQDVYKYGNYSDIDYKLLSSFNAYNNAFEYVYKNEKGNITSKVIKAEDGYPIINENNEYVGFIEYYLTVENIEYYNVFSEDDVKEYNNEGGKLKLVDEYRNESGLPIVYGNVYESEGLLSNVIDLIDEMEDLLSKLGDSIYINSLSPLLLITGQQIEGSLNKDGVGYSISLENGSDMKYVNAEMDYKTIKYYLDTLIQNLNLNSYMPSILMGNTNVANVSEVSLKMLYNLADVWALVSEKVLRKGMNDRINIIRKLLGEENRDEYINITFNYNRPSNASELLENIKSMWEMDSISRQSIIEKSPLTTDVNMELDRLKSQVVDNSSKKYKASKSVEK